jgi:hypothetical protein
MGGGETCVQHGFDVKSRVIVPVATFKERMIQ